MSFFDRDVRGYYLIDIFEQKTLQGCRQPPQGLDNTEMLVRDQIGSHTYTYRNYIGIGGIGICVHT